MLAVEGLKAAYGRIPILHGIDLNVAEGEFVGILGHNGMGKTTFLKTLIGLLRPTAGSPILAVPCSPMDRKECMIPQTVPNKPIKGVVLPVVARNSSRYDRRSTSRLVALLRARPMPFKSLGLTNSPPVDGGSPRFLRSPLAIS